MSELYNAMMEWDDEDKSYETDITLEGASEFNAIKELVEGGSELSADEAKQVQDKIYEWNEATNKASDEGNQARALVNSKVVKNLEFALQYYRSKNPN